NDDGIDSAGLRAVYDALSEVARVTVVAPASDQSAVGRSMSHEVAITDHDLGYAVDGTPADCVVAAMGELGPDPDLVVAGCNRGANLGEYVIGRSGTVSAAVEAAFFDVPAIATSLYVPAGDSSYREVAVDRAGGIDDVEPRRHALAGPGIGERQAVELGDRLDAGTPAHALLAGPAAGGERRQERDRGHAAGAHQRLLCVPSQIGALAECLQPQKKTLPSASGV
ncbi:MAG: 5'/3'-nucleotidase SurE, partial [Alphaproteobacteria bacterium]